MIKTAVLWAFGALSWSSLALAEPCSGYCATSVDQIPAATSAQIVQDGSGNRAVIVQTGSKSDSVNLTQGQPATGGAASVPGDRNVAAISQFGPGANSLTAVQYGSSNSILASQLAFFGRNSASVTQTGSGDTAGLVQAGANNTSTQTQNGSNDQQSVVQLGNNNVATYTQTGSGLQNIGVTETGNETVTIAQTAGSPTVITVMRNR